MKKSELRNIIREEIQREQLNEAPKTKSFTISVTLKSERNWTNYPKVVKWVKSSMKDYQIDKLTDKLYNRRALRISNIPPKDFKKTKFTIERMHIQYGFHDYKLYQ